LEESLTPVFTSTISRSKGLIRVTELLKEKGIDARVITLGDSTRTSQLAADSLGCTIAEIAKSVVFLHGDSSVIVVISGDKRVDMKKLIAFLGGKVSNADAEIVREKTGYVIGGVPPFPHNPDVLVLLDNSLNRFDKVWAAAGTPNSVMRIGVRELADTLNGGFIDLAS
jgi:prolyl-tRNA editing enzyme YbaK/EbsC (Cys-tRNA(Pro) deacylase)